jgi:hypothetical protein
VITLDWHEAAEEYDSRTDAHCGRLASLPEEWQRELVALRRLISQVCNGGYLQFIANCGRETYEYASRALKQAGARKTAALVDRCQALVEEHFPTAGKMYEELGQLLPNVVLSTDGRVLKPAGSVLPESVRRRVSELSRQLMGLSERDYERVQRHFGPLIERDRAGRA